MSLNRAEGIYPSSASTHAARVKKAMAPVTLTESMGQDMLSQRLLAGMKLLALVHREISSQLPWINTSVGTRCRVDRISSDQVPAPGPEVEHLATVP